MQEHIGEIAALSTALCWTITGISFELASKRIGSLSLNIIRLLFAFIYLGVFGLITRGYFIPIDAGLHQWKWLGISAIAGFIIGDYCLFRAFALISSRTSMLIMTLVPPITALVGYFILSEILTWVEIMGMVLVVGGISIAILTRGGKKVRLQYNRKGLLFALGGAAGQAVGLVLSKYGMQDFDPFAATHIRIMVGAVGFIIIAIVFKKTKKVLSAFKDLKGMKNTIIGSVFGPFLGVSLSLFAVQRASTGVASTLMSIVPILIILPSYLIFKQKVTLKEVLGAVISLFGVYLLFL